MWRSRSALVTLGLVVATGLGSSVLVGCSAADPEPRVAPSSPASTSASVSPSPSASGPVEPTMPAAAKRHTAAGAEAFVRFYWEMVNYAQSSGDVSGLTQLSGPRCSACSASLRGLRRQLAHGAHIEGGVASIHSVDSSRLIAGNGPAFVVTADVTTTREVISYEGGSRKDDVYPAGRVPLRFIVQAHGDGLRLAFWDKQS